ncbi:NAD(P)-binding protein [Auriscalpium vulgare]|uniref:NAD(P)-binding protein n=1 Tax=Auriscalpium vulgare TaxID=40419 RepID=A0ACB8S0L7_9AGAM|nr:NAD(P)-binding protein [Auriscalpium vulgare]
MLVSYFVTGANRGIGLEFVNKLSQDESNLVFGTARSLKRADKLNALADINDIVALKAAAEGVASITGGSLDVLINNAAFIQLERPHLAISEYDEDNLVKDIETSVHVNVTGVILTTNVLLPLLRKRTNKQVINVTSALGDIPFTELADFEAAIPYSISKAALNMTNLKYAIKLREEGFTFLLLSPGIVGTHEKSSAPEVAGEMKLARKAITLYPNWKGPLTTHHGSVLLKKMTQKTHNGAFLSQNGNQEWL